MGLDMYLFKLSKNKLLKEGEKYTREELDKLYKLRQIDYTENVCDTIKNNSTKIICEEEVFDLELLVEFLKKNNIKIKRKAKYLKQHVICCEYVLFGLYDDNYDLIEEISVKNENFPEIIKKQNYDYLVFDADEINYQRKGLTEEGWDLLPGNCEYCDDYEKISNLTKVGGLNASFEEDWEDGTTIFYAWW